MLFFFDTETTGLPRNYGAPTSDTENWPRMVSVAWLLYADRSPDTLLDSGERLIIPSGYTIPEKAAALHGITTEIATERGHRIQEVLPNLFYLIREAQHIVGHNVGFDQKILGAEFWRGYNRDPLAGRSVFCTMKASTSYCGIRNPKGGMKWPNLSELHTKLFGEAFEGAHGAKADIEATARCYFELVRLGVI